MYNFQLAHVLFSKEEGLSGDRKRERRAELRKALQGLVPKLSHFRASALITASLMALSLISWWHSVLACLTSHLRLSHLTVSQLSAGVGQEEPASLRATMNQEDPPPPSWGVKVLQSPASLSAWGVGKGAQNWHPTENMSSNNPFPHFYPYCLMHVNGIEMCDAQMMVEIAVAPNHSQNKALRVSMVNGKSIG